MLALALALACASTPAEAPAGTTAAVAAPPHAEGASHGEHQPAEAHAASGGDHAAGHGDHATVNDRFDDPERWAAVFDDPSRDAWQKPVELVAALGLQPGMAVADVGAGTGYFNRHLAAAVGPTGTVIAVDIEPALVEHMTSRAAREGTPQVQARLGTAADPALQPGEVDLVMLVNTYHHIDGRVAWFSALRQAVRPGGRLAVVDYRMGDIPHGPPEEHRIPQEQVVAELTQAGWTPAGSLEVLPHQFVQLMAREPG